jgi:hypothetical protein
MKLHVAIGQYEFIEVECETPAQAREAYEGIKSFFPDNDKVNVPQTQHNVSSAHEGSCDKCGSALIPGKNGKKPYCKPCYIKWKEAQDSQ